MSGVLRVPWRVVLAVLAALVAAVSWCGRSARRLVSGNQRPAMAAARPAATLRAARRAALALIAVLVLAASLVSFAESYRGLYLWADRHGLHGLWAAIWPLQVDVFIAVGELALFVALADAWRARSRAAAWPVTLAGLAASVAGNVGHVSGHGLADRVTAAVPPLAAAAALAVGLGVLKRVVAGHQASAPAPAPEVHPLAAPALNGRVHPERIPSAPRTRTRDRTPSAPVTGEDAEREFMADLASSALPSLRQIRARLHVGQDRARQLRAHLEALTRA